MLIRNRVPGKFLICFVKAPPKPARTKPLVRPIWTQSNRCHLADQRMMDPDRKEPEAAVQWLTRLKGGATMVWTGRVISALVILFLLMDAGVKLIHPSPPQVASAFAGLGCPQSLAVPIGVLLLCCVAIYAIPRTAPIGAVLLTGYLGGAIFAHWRVGDPLWSHVLFPVYFGILAWLGLFLRDARVRQLLS
jgi:hypothetical protein